MLWVEESFAFVCDTFFWMDCFKPEASSSGLGLLVVMASHRASRWPQGPPPGEREQFSAWHCCQVCIFQGHMKLTFIATPGLGAETLKTLLFRSLSGLWGGTFFRVCMPAPALMLWNRERVKLPEAARWRRGCLIALGGKENAWQSVVFL